MAIQRPPTRFPWTNMLPPEEEEDDGLFDWLSGGAAGAGALAGIIGAPFTGGASLLLGPMAGAAASGLVNTGKALASDAPASQKFASGAQGLGQAMGMAGSMLGGAGGGGAPPPKPTASLGPEAAVPPPTYMMGSPPRQPSPMNPFDWQKFRFFPGRGGIGGF